MWSHQHYFSDPPNTIPFSTVWQRHCKIFSDSKKAHVFQKSRKSSSCLTTHMLVLSLLPWVVLEGHKFAIIPAPARHSVETTMRPLWWWIRFELVFCQLLLHCLWCARDVTARVCHLDPGWLGWQSSAAQSQSIDREIMSMMNWWIRSLSYCGELVMIETNPGVSGGRRLRWCLELSCWSELRVEGLVEGVTGSLARQFT